MNNLIRLTIIAGMVFVMSSCSNRADTDPEGVVAEKAQARWDARIKGENEKLYDFISPSARTLKTKKVYLAKFGSKIAYQKVTVENVKCEEKKDKTEIKFCVASLNITYQFHNQYSGVVSNTRSRKEKWIKENNDWWLVDN